MIAVFADHHMGQGAKGSQASFLQSGGQTPDDRSALRLGPPHVLVNVAKWRSRVERFFFCHHRDLQQKRAASSIKMRWLGPPSRPARPLFTQLNLRAFAFSARARGFSIAPNETHAADEANGKNGSRCLTMLFSENYENQVHATAVRPVCRYGGKHLLRREPA
jgi:hypothetical protein